MDSQVWGPSCAPAETQDPSYYEGSRIATRTSQGAGPLTRHDLRRLASPSNRALPGEVLAGRNSSGSRWTRARAGRRIESRWRESTAHVRIDFQWSQVGLVRAIQRHASGRHGSELEMPHDTRALSSSQVLAGSRSEHLKVDLGTGSSRKGLPSNSIREFSQGRPRCLQGARRRRDIARALPEGHTPEST